MLIKTRGIVLKAIKYSESSLILDVYTESKGLRKYIISGVRNKRSRLKIGVLRPASLIDLVAYHRDHKPMNRIKEIKAAHIYQTVPFELFKGTISLFMTELIQKTVKEEEANPELFEFLFDQYVRLDEQPQLDPNHHLRFMLELTRYLGFFPGGGWSEETPWLDLRDGVFSRLEPLHQYSANQRISQQIGQLLRHETPELNRQDRHRLLDKLVDYYRLHVENFNGLNTHEILREVME